MFLYNHIEPDQHPACIFDFAFIYPINYNCSRNSDSLGHLDMVAAFSRFKIIHYVYIYTMYQIYLVEFY